MKPIPFNTLAAAVLAAGFSFSASCLAQGKGGSTAGGPVLIDQARAEAGGVTPGDAPGFPVTLSQPGRYRLVGNLKVADANTNAIQIAASGVTLDLDGYTIQGPASCSSVPGAGLACSPAGATGVGIALASGISATAHNGSVAGFRAGLLGTQVSGRFQDFHFRDLTAFGMLVTGQDVHVVGNTVTRSGGVGIQAAGLVRDNVVHRTGGAGIVLAPGSLVTGNLVSETGQPGFTGVTPGAVWYAGFNAMSGSGATYMPGALSLGDGNTNACGASRC